MASLYPHTECVAVTSVEGMQKDSPRADGSIATVQFVTLTT